MLAECNKRVDVYRCTHMHAIRRNRLCVVLHVLYCFTHIVIPIFLGLEMLQCRRAFQDIKKCGPTGKQQSSEYL
jgi:hypothetical protein